MASAPDEAFSRIHSALKSAFPEEKIREDALHSLLDAFLKTLEDRDAMIFTHALFHLPVLAERSEHPDFARYICHTIQTQKHPILSRCKTSESAEFAVFFDSAIKSALHEIDHQMDISNREPQSLEGLLHELEESLPLSGSTGKPLGIREKAVFFDNLLQTNVPFFFFVCDENRKIIRSGPSIPFLTGKQEQELLDASPWSILFREDGASVEESHILSVLHDERCWSGDLSLARKTRDPLPVFVSVFRTTGEDGNSLYLFSGFLSEKPSVFSSIRRRPEEEEREKRYRSLVDGMREGYFIAREDRLSLVNRAFMDISGYTKAELIGKNFLDLILSSNREILNLWWNQVSRPNDSKPIDLVIVRKDGTHAMVECKAHPITLDGKPHIAGFVFNITDKRRMEKQLRRYVDNLEKMVAERTKELKASIDALQNTQTQLVQSEKLAGVGILSAGIAHEINNPLQALVLKAKYILKHADEPVDVEQSARDIIKYVNRMADIVRGLSSHARSVKDDDPKAYVDLIEVFKESLELSYHTRSTGSIIVRREFDPTVPKIFTNKGQLQQVFINLILNAIDALKGKGTMTLRLKSQSDSFILAEVEDNGCGIPAENMSKIFTPLFTTKPTGKGIGMGLHVTHRIVESIGAKISVRSEPGKGSVFSVLIPWNAPKKKPAIP